LPVKVDSSNSRTNQKGNSHFGEYEEAAEDVEEDVNYFGEEEVPEDRFLSPEGTEWSQITVDSPDNTTKMFLPSNRCIVLSTRFQILLVPFAIDVIGAVLELLGHQRLVLHDSGNAEVWQ
jgi:hypothetical protein